MATPEEVTALRRKLGEAIEVGETDADTLFTDAELGVWLDEFDTSDGAALEGWKVKLAEYAKLVTVTDGAALRQMSDLFAHAQAMVKLYTGLAEGPTSGRTRIGRIVRK